MQPNDRARDTGVCGGGKLTRSLARGRSCFRSSRATTPSVRLSSLRSSGSTLGRVRDLGCRAPPGHAPFGARREPIEVRWNSISADLSVPRHRPSGAAGWIGLQGSDEALGLREFTGSVFSALASPARLYVRPTTPQARRNTRAEDRTEPDWPHHGRSRSVFSALQSLRRLRLGGHLPRGRVHHRDPDRAGAQSVRRRCGRSERGVR